MSLISYVTKIHFAENLLEDAIEVELELLGLRRPLIISDNGAGRRGIVDRLLETIPRSVSALLYEIPAGRATEEACLEAATLFADWEADGVIGFGGASAINLAKAVTLCIGHSGPPHKYAGLGGRSASTRQTVPPVIAVPTIAGSCFETVSVAILSMRDGRVMSLVNPLIMPRVVICDPTLTLDLPARQTAGAGMDALTHCIETYIATAYNPPADGIARDGLRRVIAHIERAVADGSDLAARREMMAAALNGALAHQKGLGGVHAMSHALGGLAGKSLEHGAVNAVLLPLVLEFNAPAVAARYDEIKQEFGLPPRADLCEAIIRLRERIALPACLGDMGIEAGDLERAAVSAEADYSNRTNPRHAAASDYLSMLQAAL
ncbi:iron-containing alcohol dehydrogenase [Aquamicrobium sp. LC103]|uniref:iron-containing alcohol dehydrogenase n=1 Tax=Aquamicrobium sp. LC103 TaxID=1120658 RepID=UPI00063EA72C|nr:iron-containing alcohol dehydrogenase [Aquamicrobium sp. LC103]TKT76227.1 iron-containing alcohol dehydrogenase [Aquamicrobium sp. LC103]